MAQVQQLEVAVWKTTPLPTHQTLTAIKHGGIIVGAYDKDKLVGFSYGFSAFKEGKPYLCSHMLGIDEQYRSQRIGEKLKFAQRDIALAKGYDLMVWTYDPLETRNGYLNLTKLNGICDTYVENCYGEMEDGFNKGLPSDRFEIHWYINSDYVKHKPAITYTNAVPLAEVTFDEQGLPHLKKLPTKPLTGAAYSLPVPKDFQQLKTQDAALAREWRFTTRECFTRLFIAGYAAIRLEQHEQWNTYIFVKKQTLPLGGN